MLKDMPRFSLKQLFAVATAIVLAFAGLRALNAEFDPFNDAKFRPTAWATADRMERARMSDDLVCNHLTPGLSRSEVEALIGKGQLVWTKSDVEKETHHYDIGGWPSLGWFEAFVVVTYDENGNVVEAKIDGL
jgi:hypothetical protein